MAIVFKKIGKQLHEALEKLFSIDYRSLAAFRVGLGLLILADLWNRLGDLEAHYSNFGVLPIPVLLEKFSSSHFISIHFMNGSVEYQGFLFFVQFLLALCLLVGYKTKLASVLSWYWLISLQMRMPIVLQGGDVLFRMLLFWSMFLPLNRAYSLDLALSSKEIQEKARKTKKHLSVATFALLGQVFILYIFTALLKIHTSWLEQGDAIYYVMHLEEFLTHFGLWLSQFSKELTVLTPFVWAWEMFGPFLFFFPLGFKYCRWIGVLGFLAMHFGFLLMMELGLFPYVDFVSLLPFFLAGFWDQGERILAKMSFRRFVIFYDYQCGICFKLVSVFRVFGFYKANQFIGSDSRPDIDQKIHEEDSWLVQAESTQPFLTRWSAVKKVLSASPGLWPFFVLSSLVPSSLGEYLYKSFAKNRQKIAQKMSFFLRPSTLGFRDFGAVSCFCAFCIVVVVVWNLSYLKIGVEFPSQFKGFVKTLRLDQKWNMFSPFPLTNDGWCVIEGNLLNKKVVDVYSFKPVPPSFKRPALISATFSNQRWRKYMMNLWNRRYKKHRKYYGRWLCRRWNRKYKKDERLKNFKIHYMLEKTPPINAQAQPVRKVMVWSHRCF